MQKPARDDWKARFLQMRQYCREANNGARVQNMVNRLTVERMWKAIRETDEYRRKWIETDTKLIEMTKENERLRKILERS